MKQEQLREFISNINVTITEALRALDINGSGILFMVDDDGHLVGALTDGDIRRWLLNSGSLDADISSIMNSNPRFLYEDSDIDIVEYMRDNRIKAVPILDSEHVVLDIVLNTKIYETVNHARTNSLKGVPVVIMAGGKGTRLYPYTSVLPKPLIPIGDIPIIERIMDRFYEYGAECFTLTVNYKREMLKSYFADRNPAYSIKYVEEEIPLGTAGSLRLIDGDLDRPLIVTNCDIIIDSDYEKIYSHHRSSGNDMTIVSSIKNITIPYGVIHTSEHGNIESMEEKPRVSVLINTGMYVINPEVISMIPADTVFHMTDLADILMHRGLTVGMYPVSEQSFFDMGELGEMKKMEEWINNGFGK